MYIKTIVIAILLVTVLGFVIAGCSTHHFSNKSPEEKAQWISEKISKELDLNDSQNAKLKEIETDILTKYKEHGDTKAELWNELNKQLNSDNIDEQSLNETFAAKEKQFSEMRVLLVSKFAEFYAVLTPEQRHELSEKLNTMHERWRH